MPERKQEIKIDKKLPIIAAMAIFMQSLDSTILNTALPSIAKDLGENPLSMQSVVVAYALTLALLIPLSGWLADKYGTRKIFMFAVGLFTIGSFLCAVSNSLLTLVLSRVLQAIGGSMMVPVSRLALLYAYPKNQLLRIMNIVTMPGLIGPLVGPLLGGWMVQHASWHWIFLVNIPIGIAGILLSKKSMPNFTGAKRNFDTLGLVLFSGGLVLLSLGIDLNGEGKYSHVAVAGIIAVSLLLLLTYIFHARRVKTPLIDLNLFKIRTLRTGLIGNLATRLGTGSMPFLLPLLFQVGFSHTPTTSGMMLVPSALATIAAKSWIVPLIRKFGYKTVLISNTFVLAITISMFAIPDSSTSILWFIPILIIYGSANSVQLTAMNTISMADLNSNNASGGNSLLTIMQQLSMSFGVSVGAAILRLNEGFTWLTHNNIQIAFKYTFIFLGIITAISSIVFFALKKSDGNMMSGRV